MSSAHFYPSRSFLKRSLLALGLAPLLACGNETGGAPSQSGGSANGGGNAGSAGSAGSSVTAGSSGTPGGGSGGQGSGGTAGSAGTAGTGGLPVVVSDAYVTDVAITVHEEVETILVVNWTQAMAAESTWLEFVFENNDVMTSRPKPGVAGPHRDVVLGVPEQTVVTVRVVSRQGGMDYKTMDYTGTTEALPAGIPRPEVMDYNAALASPERWMLGSVEDSEGGCGPSCYNQWTYWTFIMDRQGRIVWYYADPASGATSSFQRLARDGEYIWIEKRSYSEPSLPRTVVKMTLDWEYFDEVDVDLEDCIDVTDSGSLLYDLPPGGQLVELARGATQPREIWNCEDYFADINNFQCYSNTVNWDPVSDTVLMSFPDEDTVVEIDRETGALVGQYGAAPGSYEFIPASRQFEFQHFPNITADRTLMVSTHNPGTDTYQPEAGEHAFIEFDINHDSETLTERWVYDAGQEWAMYKGMAIKLANGNVLANYGSGGVIREITPDGQTVFYAKFDAPQGDDFYNKMVGHNVFVADLYALNGGGPAQ